MAAHVGDDNPRADEKQRSASPVRKPSRDRSRSPRRREIDINAAPPPVPDAAAAAASRASVIRGIMRDFAVRSLNLLKTTVCLVHFPNEPALSAADIKDDYNAIIDACKAAIHDRDWSELKNLKIASCPAEAQRHLDQTVEHIASLPACEWEPECFIRHVSGLLIGSSFHDVLHRSESVVWIPLLLRLCAHAVSKGVNFNAEEDNYNRSTLLMRLARAAAHAGDHHKTNPLRARLYRVVYNTVNWMLRGSRMWYDLVDADGRLIERRMHGSCSKPGCTRQIREYRSSDYGFCNNRHMDPEFWVTPMSEKKFNPPYRCAEHATKKFLAIEAEKFELLKQKKRESERRIADRSATAAAAAATIPAAAAAAAAATAAAAPATAAAK